ncbi:MAG: cyclopropane-fatty-acyl-phospholipid synthase family protein [Pseudomonadota bacterium]
MSVSTDFNNTILVDKQNFDETRKTIPFFARKAFDLLVKIEKGKLLLQLPGGTQYAFESGSPGPEAHIVLHSWRLPRKVITSGTIGVAESYMDGDWDSSDVTQMLEFFLQNRKVYEGVASQSPIINLIENARHWLNRNSKSGSKRNISAHYDLGNDFYSFWLDPSMTYSSAIYEDGANSLERAQEDKYHSLAKNMGITPDSHVLEIGCGWGGFAEYVAREIGARVTGLTISREQLDFAQQRIQKASLGDKVQFKFQDYRDETNTYDQIASIEMFEAVGEKYWPVYFEKIGACLKPDGVAGLQIITIADAGFENYRKRADFIQRYIFPGGMLPSPLALEAVTASKGLKLVNERAFALDYAKTLREWRGRFWDKWDDIKALGFDERFKRMWEFYFYYCEAGFKTQAIDVRQMFYKHS